MASQIRRSLQLFGLTVLLLVLSSPPTHAAAQQTCSDPDINYLIQRLPQLTDAQIQKLAQCGSITVRPLTAILNSNQPASVLQAVLILQEIGPPAREATPALVAILSNKSQKLELRTAIAYALEAIKPGDRKTVEALLAVFQQELDTKLRSASALALASNIQGDRDADGIEILIATLKGQGDESIRVYAAFTIATIATGYPDKVRSLATQPLLELLQDNQQSNRVVAESVYAINTMALDDQKTITTLIQLTNRRDDLVRQRVAITLADITDRLYSRTTKLSQIDEQLKTFQQIHSALDPLDGTTDPDIRQAKDTVNARIQGLQDKRQALWMQLAQQYVVGDRSFWIIHPLFWLALIFAYPRSSRVQAIFFWNKYIREILGLWYVSAIITWVPTLRCRLFAPFKDSLLSDAKLDSFDPQAFFTQSGVKLKGADAIQPIQQVLPEIKGQIILEGDSGLGKTMMLRQLVRQSKRITVYLPAQKCENGVIEAIQAKLHGQAQDADFLKKLIYSGALDICIDGLNEVKPDVRANIKAFVESYFKGNIIMTTQPLLWEPPSTAKTYVIQPLQRDQIEQFLHLRELRLPPDAQLHGTPYKKVCTNFLTEALTNPSTSDDSVLTRRILSNPMDLTIVAQMLARGLHPDLFHLQEQQYKLMVDDYERSWNQPFPLKQFSESAYQMRDEAKYAMTGETFYQALTIMEKEQHRMVLSRQWKDKKGDNQQEWSFRHDKILEFFVVQTFMGNGPDGAEKRKKHMGDPRFRGIYLLLAQVLPLKDALQLREDLIQYAVDTQDHTVSDAYVQLMRSRTASTP